jgi:NAD(P)-dependent dehydrogenase (short-subunit alcohol dehydrogenase family)
MSKNKKMKKQKVAIVTGANGNLGTAVVQKFLENEYTVIGIVHKRNETRVEHDQYQEVVCDLSNEDDCQKIISNIIEKYQAIDAVILTAGGLAMGNIESTGTAQIQQQFQLNFVTAYNVARPVFLQMMQQNSGRLFLIGSQAGLNTAHAKGVTAYGLSKSLLFDLAKIMNAESKGKNVVTSVIVPGIIDTPQNRKDMPNKDFSQWTTPSQIADVIYFYSSQEASVIREPVIKVYNKL